MKNSLIILFAVTTFSLGAICVVQWQKRTAQREQITALRGESEQKTRELADAQAAQELLQKQRHESLLQAGDLAAKLQTQRLATAKAAARAAAASRKPGKGKPAFGEFFSTMMNDPDARKMIRETHRVMLNQLYDPLIKQMGMTPEEAAQFKDLLADNMMKGAEKASSLFGGGMTNRAEMLKLATAEQKAADEQIRQFLGETRYAQYKSYQETVNERTQLNQFRQQNAGGENALTDQQIEQLLTFMKEEKQGVAATAGLPASWDKRDPANLEAMFSDEGVQKLLQAQEQVSQRVYERAQTVLSENQLAAFGLFQTNQLQMMRMGMNMMRKFMATE